MNMNAARAEAAAPDSEGLNPDAPIVIAAATPLAGVPAEYAWLKEKFGLMEDDWVVDLRSLARNARGRTIETFRVRLKSGERVDVHFDITDFHQL